MVEEAADAGLGALVPSPPLTVGVHMHDSAGHGSMRLPPLPCDPLPSDSMLLRCPIGVIITFSASSFRLRKGFSRQVISAQVRGVRAVREIAPLERRHTHHSKEPGSTEACCSACCSADAASGTTRNICEPDGDPQIEHGWVGGGCDEGSAIADGAAL